MKDLNKTLIRSVELAKVLNHALEVKKSDNFARTSFVICLIGIVFLGICSIVYTNIDKLAF